MKHTLRLMLMAVMAFVCTAAGAQELHEYLFNVGQFDKLNVTDNVNVIYRCVPDSTGYVVYHGETDFADAFIFTNSKGSLRIQVTTEDVGKPGLPVVYVYSDFLNSVENSSDFTVRIESPAPSAKFKARQVGNGSIIVDNLRTTQAEGVLTAGNGQVTLSGICEKAVYKMVGNGLISADRLRAKDVECKILGAGQIGCWAVEDLEVKGIGSTKIYYKGDPDIVKTGGGKLYPLAVPGE